jgi:hypothetical protein
MSLIIPLIVFALASFITGIAGFGLGLVSMGVLSLLLNLRYANLIITFVWCIQIFFILLPIRKHISWYYVLPLILGMAVGAPIGVFALANVDEHLLKRVLGGFIVLYVIYDLFFREKYKIRLNRWSGIGFGLVSGALGGAFSVAGPPAIMYLTSQDLEKYALKASMAAYLMGIITLKIPFFFINDLLSLEDLPIILLFLIPGIGCAFLGVKVFHRIPAGGFRIVVQVLLFASGAMLLIKG